MSTGATNYATGEDQIAALSQRDTELLDTFAPGARFNGASADGGIRTMQGTSQAAAFVSGAAALAQQIARQELGRRLSTGEFSWLLRHSGAWITDGDDEVDNVNNTGEQFRRLDMVKLVALVATLDDVSTNGEGSDPGTAPGTAIPKVLEQAEAGVHTVKLEAGSREDGRDCGNFQLGKVAGVVFDDVDRDGQRDPEEKAKAGITVFLDANGNEVLDAGERMAVTDAMGQYAFEALGLHLAKVRAVMPAGFETTTALTCNPPSVPRQ